MALGKKLDSLLENYFGNTDYSDSGDVLLNLELDKIVTSPYQPRHHFDDSSLTALAQNIESHGLVHPITVIDLEDGRFQLISGERRYRAFGILMRATIPAVVKSKHALNDKQQATLGIFENLHRENLSAMDTAKAFAALKEMHNWSNQELADFLNCSKQHIDNYFRLFELSPEIGAALSDNLITEGHARLLHSFDFSVQKQILDQILDQSLSVKGTQKMIDSLFKPKSKSIKPVTSEIRQVLNTWKEKFPAAKIVFSGSAKQGSLVIKWNKAEDFPQF